MGIFSVPTGCVNGQLVTEKLTLGRLLAASSLLATFKRSRSHLSSSSQLLRVLFITAFGFRHCSSNIGMPVNKGLFTFTPKRKQFLSSDQVLSFNVKFNSMHRINYRLTALKKKLFRHNSYKQITDVFNQFIRQQRAKCHLQVSIYKIQCLYTRQRIQQVKIMHRKNQFTDYVKFSLHYSKR